MYCSRTDGSLPVHSDHLMPRFWLSATSLLRENLDQVTVFHSYLKRAISTINQIRGRPSPLHLVKFGSR